MLWVVPANWEWYPLWLTDHGLYEKKNSWRNHKIKAECLPHSSMVSATVLALNSCCNFPSCGTMICKCKLNKLFPQVVFHSIREQTRTWAKLQPISVVWFHFTYFSNESFLNIHWFFWKLNTFMWYIVKTLHFDLLSNRFYIVCNLLSFDQWNWPGHGIQILMSFY